MLGICSERGALHEALPSPTERGAAGHRPCPGSLLAPAPSQPPAFPRSISRPQQGDTEAVDVPSHTLGPILPFLFGQRLHVALVGRLAGEEAAVSSLQCLSLASSLNLE